MYYQHPQGPGRLVLLVKLLVQEEKRKSRMKEGGDTALENMGVYTHPIN